MFNVNRVKTEFKTLVGWKQTAQTGSCFDNLSNDLKTSDSCIFVNDLPLVDIDVINDVYPKDYSDINDYLNDVRDDAILSGMNDFVNYQKTHIKTKELISNLSIGVTAGNIREYVVNRSRFVGYEITPRGSNSVMASLIQLGVHFDTAVTDMPIYFYTSSETDPIKTFMITTTKAGSLQWITLATDASASTSDCQVDVADVVANYISENYGTGNRYFLGYYETDLTAQGARAVQTKMQCGNCGGSSVSRYDRFVTIHPIEVNAGSTFLSKELFNVDNAGTTSETYGLHLKMNIKCDLTSIIVQNKNMFAHLIRLKQAERVLWDAYNSNKLTSTHATKKADFRLMAEKYELNFKEHLKTLSIDFSGLDKQCIGEKSNVFTVMNL